MGERLTGYPVIDWDKVTIPMDLAEFMKWFGFALVDERATFAFDHLRMRMAPSDRHRAMHEIAEAWWREQPTQALSELREMAQAALIMPSYQNAISFTADTLLTRYQEASMLFTRSPMDYLERLMACSVRSIFPNVRSERCFRRLMLIFIELTEPGTLHP